MEEILLNYEDIMLDELKDLIAIKKNGGQYSTQHICDGEKILKSIEHIERVLMLDAVDYPEENGNYRYGNYSNGSSSGRSYRYGNYSTGGSYRGYNSNRSGHDANIRAEVERRMNMARNDNERAVYSDWLNELDHR